MATGPSWQEFKRRASFHYYLSKARRAKIRSKPTLQGSALIAGLFSSPNGIGRGARLIFDGFNALGIQASSYDLTPHIQPELSKIKPPESHFDDGKGPVILHVNPTETPKALHILRHTNWQNRRLIGVWAWELEQVPSPFIECAKLFDEVWSISEFSKKSFKSLAVPIVNMGYPLKRTKDSLETGWKEKLGIEDRFVILTTFDSRSSLSRKNPEAVVKAFSAVFSNDDPVTLVVKAGGPLRSKERDIFSASNICLIEDYLNENEMTDLIRSVDCYFSLTRAEGYGLVAAEASSYGVPTIITGWSAPAEWNECPNIWFVDYTLIPAKDEYNVYDDIPGRRWADPDVIHAAKCLETVFTLNSEQKEKLSEGSIEWWRDKHGIEAFAARFSAATQASLLWK
jgi:glycosyltransferase involved in cell wall biosynthesis